MTSAEIIGGKCTTVSNSIFTKKGSSGYRGNVVYSKRATLKKGDVVLVLAELQAVQNTSNNIMFGSFLV